MTLYAYAIVATSRFIGIERLNFMRGLHAISPNSSDGYRNGLIGKRRLYTNYIPTVISFNPATPR